MKTTEYKLTQAEMSFISFHEIYADLIKQLSNQLINYSITSASMVHYYQSGYVFGL